jgi:hypothetical protein
MKLTVSIYSPFGAFFDMLAVFAGYLLSLYAVIMIYVPIRGCRCVKYVEAECNKMLNLSPCSRLTWAQKARFGSARFKWGFCCDVQSPT